MSVTEIASSTGAWSLTLRPDTPSEILDKLDYFGHIAILPGRVDPDEYGDSLMESARFIGVNRDRSFGEDNKKIGGPGMAFWLGDEDGKGYTIETPLVFTDATFTSVVSNLLPPSLQVGTITALPGLYNGQHVFTSRRQAIDYVFSLYDAEWRIHGKGVFDAGLVEDLYVTEPKTAILRNRSGLEMDYKALRGKGTLDSDVKDFTTRVLMLAQATEASTVTATADILPGLNPYNDLFGNDLVLTRIVQESGTSEGNADARAQLQLNRFTSPRDALKLSTSEYDIRGDVETGDYVWVYDPDAKLMDTDNEIDFHGETIWPLKLRLFQMTWPVTDKMGVAFRSNAGVWLDLTDWFVPEASDTDLVVGGYNRSLTGVGSGSGDSPGSLPTDNTSIPDVVDWNLPFVQGTYQSDADGLTRTQVVLSWDQPLNTDSTVISDGLAYEIQWRTGATRVYPTTHADMATYPHSALTGPQSAPIPYTQGEWESTQVGFDFNQFLLNDLTPGIPYDFRIRALDIALPPNQGDWSDTVTIQTRPDTTAPSTPAAPQDVAGSRNALQIVHTLGKASGGTFNLESDLNHLRIHVDFNAEFQCTDENVAGKLPANQGMLLGQIPVVGTVPLAEQPGVERWVRVVAVDNFGNESSASPPMQQTAELIDSAFISTLTVSKLISGTGTFDMLMAGSFYTSLTGNRVTLGWYGIEAYDVNNVRTFFVNSATGDVSLTGTFQTGHEGQRIRIQPGTTGLIEFFPQDGETRKGQIFSNIPTNYPDDISVVMTASDTDSLDVKGWVEVRPDIAILAVVKQANTALSTAQVNAGDHFLDLLVKDNTNGIRSRSLFDDTAIHLKMTRISDQARDGGFLFMGRGTGGAVAFGRETQGGDNSNIQFSTADANIYLVRDGIIKVGVINDGAEITPYCYSNMFAGLGNTAFAGKTNGGGTLDTFSVRNAGGTDPVLDTDGFSARFVKNFVIEHPQDADKWLVHACTEGPTAGVEYSGRVVLEENYQAWVELPPYFEALTQEEGRQVHLTIQLPSDGATYPYLPRAAAGPVKNGKFFISTDGFTGTEIAWTVKATRKDVPQFPVEPLKSEYKRAGDGPYTWLEAN
jgi:hypothetical protein